MKTLILDLETKPNEKLINLFTSKIKAYIEEKKSEAVKGMSIDVDYCEIKCIGIKIDEEPAKLISLKDLIDLFNEHIEIKSELASEYESRVVNFKIITFNGKKFDLPIIIREAIRQGLKAPFKTIKDWTKRFQVGNHIDLMEMLNDQDYKSLDLYSQIYLGEEKTPIDFETCSDKELEEHCLSDVEMTYRLFDKFKVLV
jgi:predicted PolB exonuclease-like 3'-5' exonuclease